MRVPSGHSPKIHQVGDLGHLPGVTFFGPVGRNGSTSSAFGGGRRPGGQLGAEAVTHDEADAALAAGIDEAVCWRPAESVRAMTSLASGSTGSWANAASSRRTSGLWADPAAALPGRKMAARASPVASRKATIGGEKPKPCL